MNNDRLIIGVAGPVCGGKNTVCGILEKHGFRIIDVDLLGHEALDVKKEAISGAFGTQILDAHGAVDRKALSEIVFSSQKQLKILEEIVHPWMNERVGETILMNPEEDIVVNAAILFRMGLNGYCDAVIWVSAPVITRLKRFVKRSGQGWLAGLKRIWSQRSLKPQFSSVDTDIYDIENSGPLAELTDQVVDILNRMRK